MISTDESKQLDSNPGFYFRKCQFVSLTYDEDENEVTGKIVELHFFFKF